MTQNFRRRVRTIFLLALFGIMIGLNPGLVQAVTPGPGGYDPGFEYTPIYEIQGDGFVSPYKGQYVYTFGVVTADYQDEGSHGFFVQDPWGDGDPATSDGIYCKYGWDVSVGDYVKLSGWVSEYYGLTEMYKPYITTLESPPDNPFPEPVELNPPFDDYASDVYYEALEGMLVSAKRITAVAGTDSYGEVAAVRSDLGVKRVFQDDRAGTGEIIFIDDGGGCLVNVRTGNTIVGLVGPLDYTYDEYKVLPSADNPPQVLSECWAESDWIYQKGLRWGFTVATYNMYNLFDEFNATDKEDPDYLTTEDVELMLSKHAHAIKDMLRLPDLIAVQEVENLEVLVRLTETEPIKGIYGAVLIDGPDVRGIDVGLLYRLDRVEVISAEARQTCTDLQDAYGPETDPNFPCEEGYNPLFSRPPLVVHLRTIVNSWWCRHRYGTDLWLIINHFKSKSTYAPTYADTEPRRIEQAKWVNHLVKEIQHCNRHANVVVLGDFNSFTNEAPIKTLQRRGLKDLIYGVQKCSRYTYIYRGVSEVLDHIFVSNTLRWRFIHARIIHFNTDFPYGFWADDPTTGIRSSDHDVFMCAFWIR
ncbi:MAG: endonuclease/exonuclease/phosphatase family protein [Promethearchaeota archaeon]